MKQFTVLAVTIALSTASAGIAFADAGHGHGDNTKKTGTEAPMESGGHDMKRKMMRMHVGMMNQNMMHSMMGNGGMLGPIGPMMSMFDADGDGTVTPEEAHGQLQAMHASFDSNADGSLSIEEFELLHSSMIREIMVDRFQQLDADGDGNITAGEMTEPADKMERMNMMSGAMMGGKNESTDNN